MRNFKYYLLITVAVLISFTSYSQNGIGWTKEELIPDYQEGKYYRNLKVFKDSLVFDLVSEGRKLGREVRYFKNDICYKNQSFYVSNLSLDLIRETENTTIGVPIAEDIWSYTQEVKDIRYYCIVYLEIGNYKTVKTLLSYTDYDEYLKDISSKLTFKRVN